MNIKSNDKKLIEMIRKFQEGGPVQGPETPEAAPEGGAPDLGAPEGGDPAALILEAATAALQNQDCNLAMLVLQALILMLGGGAPEGPAAPEGLQPVYKKGGKLSKWIQK